MRLKQLFPSYGELHRKVDSANENIKKLLIRETNQTINTEITESISELTEHIALVEKNMRDEIEYLKSINRIQISRESQLDALLFKNWGGTLSFAQHGEDLLLLFLFERMGVSVGDYIDIGAHHPYAVSNTAAFYLKGWRGINIEANPYLCNEFDTYRPDDVNVCAGISNKKGIMPFYVINDIDQRNGFNRELIDMYLKDNPTAHIEKVIDTPVKTIQDVLDEHNHGKCPMYMSMDIEGNEYKAISSFDIRNNGPYICDMEISQDKDRIFELMVGAGYFLYTKVGANYIWIKEQYRELILN